VAKPLVEHLTFRVDAELADELDREMALRERQGGIEIDRSKLVRLLIRVGLETAKAARTKRTP
jgi:hypothetical protein